MNITIIITLTLLIYIVHIITLIFDLYDYFITHFTR